jgi:hypothetical protein
MFTFIFCLYNLIHLTSHVSLSLGNTLSHISTAINNFPHAVSQKREAEETVDTFSK